MGFLAQPLSCRARHEGGHAEFQIMPRTAFESHLSQVYRWFFADTPRHDPDACFRSRRRRERTNEPIWKPLASMEGEIPFFDLWLLPISCRGTSRKIAAVSGFTDFTRHDLLLGMTPQKGIFHDFVTTDRSANEDGSVPNLLGFWAKEARVPRSVRSETIRFLCFISCLISPFSHCLRSSDTSGTYSSPPPITLEEHF